MPIDLRKLGPAITNGDIDPFEARIGNALPSDYRAFLLTYNGGQPTDHVIRNDATGGIRVQLFFGIRNDEFYDINRELENMRGRWPSRMVSIAIDDFGNRFCISLGPPNFGSIYFWDHEEEAEEDEEPTELNLYRLADSFAQFWAQMEPIDPDESPAEEGSDSDADSVPPLSRRPPRLDTNGTPE